MGIQNSRKINHLVVDDSTLGRSILSIFLESMGVSCDLASNGKQALSMARLKSYDIIWMDLMMPVMNGSECVKHLREFGYSGKIIIVSGRMSDDIGEMKKRKIINDIMIKPLTKNQVRYYVCKYNKKN